MPSLLVTGQPPNDRHTLTQALPYQIPTAVAKKHTCRFMGQNLHQGCPFLHQNPQFSLYNPIFKDLHHPFYTKFLIWVKTIWRPDDPDCFPDASNPFANSTIGETSIELWDPNKMCKTDSGACRFSYSM